MTEEKRQYYLSLAILGSLFATFGLVTWVNSMLIPYFRIACDLHSEAQSYLVNFAFHIAYLVMTIPASILLGKSGFKRGVQIGLMILAAGAALFWPAAIFRSYGMFLIALFTMGSALAVLQSAANPFVTIIGPIQSAAKRISIMGLCNKTAGIISPLLFAALVIKPGDSAVMQTVASGQLAGAAKKAALDGLIRGVIPPYLCLAAILLAFSFIFFKSPIPDINPGTGNKAEDGTDDRKSVFAYPYLVLGVIAIVAHLGSQQISISTLIGYAGSMGIDMEASKILPSYAISCLIIGYGLGVLLIPRFISQQKALLACTVTGLVLSCLVPLLEGPVKMFGLEADRSIWMLILLSIPNSLIYAGIWPLAIRNLGKWTNLGSSLMVMGFSGNAIMSLIFGVCADKWGYRASYWILIPCFIYLLFYATYGYKINKWKK